MYIELERIMESLQISTTMDKNFSSNRLQEKTQSHLSIKPINEDEEKIVVELIRSNLRQFDEKSSILVASFRRLENFFDLYAQEGSFYYVVKDMKTDSYIGGAGIGPLAGLPISEGIAEVRELVIDAKYRNRGIGSQLLSKCLGKAKKLGYNRIYFETTSQMHDAQKLLHRFGFNPITERKRQNNDALDNSPRYYILDTL